MRLPLLAALTAAVLVVTGCPTADTQEPSVDPEGTPEGEPEQEPETPPLDVELETWEYFEVEGARCGDGSQAGFAINRTDRSNGAYIYFEGGGACWDNITCNQLQTATYIQNGISGDTVLQQLAGADSSGQFNRDDASNPFRDMSFVYIPHCTGDVYTGSNPDSGIGVEFVGYTNVGLYLDFINDTFDNEADHIVTVGASAGGFGATLNFDRIAKQFPNAEHTLIIDSAPALGFEVYTEALQNTQRTIWNLDGNLPDSCGTDNCNTLQDIFVHVIGEHPEANAAVITSTGDETLRGFARLGQDNPLAPFTVEQYTEGVQNYYDATKDIPNTKLFVVDNNRHVFLYDDPMSSVTSEGVALVDFLEDALSDADEWDNVLPASITP